MVSGTHVNFFQIPDLLLRECEEDIYQVIFDRLISSCFSFIFFDDVSLSTVQYSIEKQLKVEMSNTSIPLLLSIYYL